MKLKFNKEINKPLAIFEKKVVLSGNGAVVYVDKKYVGKNAIVVIEGEEK